MMGLVAEDPAGMRMKQKNQAMYMTQNLVQNQFWCCGVGESLPRPHNFLAPGIR